MKTEFVAAHAHGSLYLRFALALTHAYTHLKHFVGWIDDRVDLLEA